MINRYTAKNARLTPIDARISPALSMQPYGQFRVNRALLKILGTSAGKHVQILHDDESSEWYIASCGPDGLPLRPAMNGGATFNSVVVCEAIQKQSEVDKGRFEVVSEATVIDGTKCYCILLGSAKGRAKG